MKAVRLHRYGEYPLVEEVAEPTVTSPFDVIVRVGGPVPHRPAYYRGPVSRKIGRHPALHPGPRERRLGRGGWLSGRYCCRW